MKAASDVMTPVSGTVSEINEPLGESPGQINSKAETDGLSFFHFVTHFKLNNFSIQANGSYSLILDLSY